MTQLGNIVAAIAVAIALFLIVATCAIAVTTSPRTKGLRKNKQVREAVETRAWQGTKAQEYLGYFKPE